MVSSNKVNRMFVKQSPLTMSKESGSKQESSIVENSTAIAFDNSIIRTLFLGMQSVPRQGDELQYPQNVGQAS